ncbi:hypothetical protein B0H19DRAFT_1191517 [Mycena capillaripes]|nr:hypothetical protein B0H19DRAFT_1191517 [Mycena capillaripes]
MNPSRIQPLHGSPSTSATSYARSVAGSYSLEYIQLSEGDRWKIGRIPGAHLVEIRDTREVSA